MDTVKRVEDLIKKKDMTMYQLAQKSGLSYSTIRTTQRRNGQLTVDTIESICEALDMPLKDFFDPDK